MITQTPQVQDGMANPTAAGTQATSAQKPVPGLAPAMTPPSPTPLPQPAPASGPNPAVPPGVQYPVSSTATTPVPTPAMPTLAPGQNPASMPIGQEYSIPGATPNSYAVGQSPAPSTTTSNGSVSLTPINPANDLRSQTIGVGPTANRYQIAQDQLKTYQQASDPYYQKSLRDATSQAAGAGQLGSGQLRTSLGDLALNRDLELGAQGQNFLQNALTGSIGDAYQNVNIAQQQQQRQDQAQQQAFNQQATATGMDDALQTSAQNRALQQLLAGESGNPSDTQLILSQLYGNNAAQAGSALSNLIGGTVNRNAQTQATNSMSGILQSIFGGMGGSPTPSAPTSTGPIVPPTVPSTGGTASGGLFDPSNWIR